MSSASAAYAAEGSATSVTVIEPHRGWASLDLGSLWRYHELLYFLIWRDVKVRYKQTLIGGAWAILQPLLNMLIFTVIFGRLVGVPSDGVPYAAFVYGGLVPWQLFALALNESGNSLVSNQNLLTKVYFPRLVVPVAAVLGGLVDFALAFVVLLGLALVLGLRPTGGIVFLPLFLLLAVGTALAVGLWLSALNVRYRDVRYTIPFLTQFWFFATPITYPASVIPEQYRWLMGLNPMAGVVEGFRWALLGTNEQPGLLVGISAAVVVLFLLSGLFYFRRVERTFADVV